jgi:hypothetical protein
LLQYFCIAAFQFSCAKAHFGFQGFRKLAKSFFGIENGQPRVDLGGNIPEIADHSESRFGQGDAIDAPFLKFFNVAIPSVMDALRFLEWFSSFQSVSENANDFIRIFARPENVHYFA